ncbi:hypothetical protein GJU40_02510 [Bacillus lacus]|uniref:GerMN domain-containing protein n=1 Tax=Metabacillus lacus TaxID=1983721 RepID=A0A7X2IWD8_9BACI|nr:hypothetical protein [Metabacillus lacus]MRX71041.1 hypothetical protein [Metabacillus lacus]
MKKSKVSDDQEIEHLLSQLPPVKDRRTPEEIYQNVSLKMQSSKKKIWLGPVLASAAAIFILFLFSPFLFEEFRSGSQSGNEQSAGNSSQSTDQAVTEDLPKERDDVNDVVPVPETTDLKEEVDTFVVPAESSETFITVAFRDANLQNLIPVSLKGIADRDKASQIKGILENFNEEEAGLATSFFEKVQLKTPIESKNRVQVNLEAAVLSSSADSEGLNEISETLKQNGYLEAELYSNSFQEKGVEAGNYGKLEELELKGQSFKAYYLYQADENTPKLLTPSAETFTSIDAALGAMKKSIDTHQLKSLFTESISFSKIEKSEGSLTLTFSNSARIENTEANVLMLEGILLTAKEFGYQQVKFENTNISKVGSMDLTQPIVVPASPNPLPRN